METGHSDTTNSSMTKTKNKIFYLSIQLSLNGFSFCVFNQEKEIEFKIVETSKNKFSEYELLILIKEVFDTNDTLKLNFKQIKVIYQNELFALVPKEIFEEKNCVNYLNYSVKTLATDYITFDEIGNFNIIDVFIPYINLNNYLFDALGEFNYMHSSNVLIKHILEHNTSEGTPKIDLLISHCYFEMVVSKGKELLLFNAFEYQSNEDILYYLLFCMEQLNLSPNEIPVILLNQIDSTLFELLYTYIRHVNKSNIKADEFLHTII